MTSPDLARLLEYAVTALADIATMPDPAIAQRKAQRIYDAIRAEWLGPSPDDDTEAIMEGVHIIPPMTIDLTASCQVTALGTVIYDAITAHRLATPEISLRVVKAALASVTDWVETYGHENDVDV